jgi:hypothetical protein
MAIEVRGPALFRKPIIPVGALAELSALGGAGRTPVRVLKLNRWRVVCEFLSEKDFKAFVAGEEKKPK